MQTIVIHDKKFRPFITNQEIVSSINKLAWRISEDYASSERPPILLGVLNGSFMFVSALANEININCEISFIKLSSYTGTCSSGNVKSLVGLNSSLQGRDVIVVEDIIDTGTTIEHLDKLIKDKGAKSVEYASLFLKPHCYKKDIPIKYIAREIGEEFIIGFGLDYNQLGRNFKDIYIVENE